MKQVRLTMKNYRGFAEESPLVMDLGQQFTALVGPNNAGKSSFLLSFFELRPLWAMLVGGGFAQAISSGQITVNHEYGGVGDAAELQHNRRKRPIYIELRVFPDGDADECVERITLESINVRQRTWTIKAYTSRKTELQRQSYQSIDGATLLVPHTNRKINCEHIADILSSFASTLYVGPFRSVISEVQGPYYDLDIGSTFIQTWDRWKSGVIKEENDAVGTISENIREIFKLNQLEINPLALGVGLHVRLDGRPYRLAELGAGLAEFIIVFANAAIKKRRLILIDEPESHLHPSLQAAFLTALASYSSDGVIFATHSVGLARSVSDRIYTLQKVGDASLVREFGRTSSYAEFLGEMSFTSFLELGFDSVLLVEGVNDVRTVQQFLRALRKDHRVVVLPLHGNELASGGREIELAEVRRLSTRVFALVDSERSGPESSPDLNRQAFAEVCRSLKIELCVTERRALENYFPEAAITEAFGPGHRALKPYERLADAKLGWGKSEGWRVANKMTAGDIDSTDILRFLESI